eukprot:gene17932-24394_t
MISSPLAPASHLPLPDLMAGLDFGLAEIAEEAAPAPVAAAATLEERL